MDLRLNLNGRFAGDQRYRFLLRILGVHLHDGNIRGTRRDGLDHKAHDRPGAIYARGIGLSRRGDNRLSVLFLTGSCWSAARAHNGDFLSSAGKKWAVLDFFNADYRRVVLQQEGNGEKIVHFVDYHSNRLLLPHFQR